MISEYDYSTRLARSLLGQEIADCRLLMIFDGRWKFIRCEGFRPVLFDLETDPQELRVIDREMPVAVLERPFVVEGADLILSSIYDILGKHEYDD